MKRKLLSIICAIAIMAPCCVLPTMAVIDGKNSSDYPVYDNLSYQDVDIVIPSTKNRYSSNYSSSKPDVTVPSSYDMRVSAPEALPAVRDQNPYGMCWSFSAIESAETSLIKKGLADNTIDLSELQLAYFMYHQNTDPLGNFTGDYNYITNGDTIIDMGGNSFYTTYTLANWTGVANETTIPYSDASYAVGADYSSSLASDMDFAHLQNAYWINMTDDPESVKAFVMTNGAVGMAYNEDHSSWNSDSTAYFQNTKSYTNHAVAIVGWDDNYSRTNFSSKLQPAYDGAWLIRNSWGTGAHDDGYFWLSYEDASIYDQTAFVYDMERSDNYDHNYQYDGSSSIGSFSVIDKPSTTISNVYTAQNNEKLEAIAFSNPRNTNVFYEVSIYLNPTDANNPLSGTLVESASTSGMEVYAGYHTIELPTAVTLSEGDVFAVVINLTDTQGEDIDIAFDCNMNYGWIACKSVAEPGQSFYSFNGGYTWTDMTTYKANSNIRIKAFTKEIGFDRPSGLTASVDSEKNVTLNWEDVSGATEYEVYQKSETENDYSLIATVSSSDYTYTSELPNGTSVFYKVKAKNGTTESAFSLGTGIRLPISRRLRGFDFEITDWVTVPNSVSLAIGDTQSTSVNFYNNGDDKTMSFYSEDTKVATISSTGLITAIGSGTTEVHAVARDCSDDTGRDKTIMVYVPRDIIVNTQEEMQSSHPYAAGIDERYIYRVEGATSISMTFSDDTKTVPGNDNIKIYDMNNNLIGTYSGATLAGKTIKVNGDTFIVRLQTVSGTYYGFRVTNIITSGNLVNKDVLLETINNYSGLKQSDYSTESWAAYQSVLASAQSALNDNSATQDTIDGLVVALNNAYADLKPYISVNSISITAEDAIKVNNNYFVIVPKNTAFDKAGIQLGFTVNPTDAMYASKTWSNDFGWLGINSDGYASPYWDFASEDLITLTLTDDFGKEISSDIMLYFVHYMADKIVLSKSSVFMPLGSEDIEITANVLDNNNNAADYTEVTWSTSDSSVATVEDGVIKAVGLGTATIRATSDTTGVYSECVVTVTDGVVSVIAADDTTTVVDEDTKFIYGLNAGIDSLDGYAAITDLTCTFDYVEGSLGFGTGTVVNVMKNGNAVNRYEIVIFGDVNGDGWYDGMDATLVACLADGLLTQEQVSAAQYKAADANHDGVIDELDVSLLNQAGVFLSNVDQESTVQELQTSSAYISYINLIDQTGDTGEDVPPYVPIEEPVVINPFYTFIDSIISFIAGIVMKIASLF